MPETAIRYFRDDDGTTPFLDWLALLQERDEKALDKCLYLLDQLRRFGYELRRPQADLLRDGVYELRTKVGRVNYRMLYGFIGKDVVLVSHGFTKEKEVPEKEIDRAIKRLALYQSDPTRYATTEEIEDGN